MYKVNCLHSSLIFLSILSLVASCTKVSVNPVYEDTDIYWNVVCRTPSTKAATVLPDAASFATCVWKLESGTWEANKASASLLQPYYTSDPMNGKTSGYVTKVGSKWKVDGKQFWWPETGSLNFLSFTVANLNNPSAPLHPNNLTWEQKGKVQPQKDGLRIEAWHMDNDQYADILVAEMQVDKKTAENYLGMSGVKTEFSHVLSKVKLVFLKSDQEVNYTNGDIDGTTITLKKVTLKNYWYKSTMTGGGTINQSWDHNSPSTNVKESKDFFTGNIVLNKTIETPAWSDERLHIPQNLKDATKNFGGKNLEETKIYIEYNVIYGGVTTPKTAEISLPQRHSNVWESGKSYTYIFKLGAKLAPIEFNASVSDWSASDTLINGGVIEL